MGDLLRQGAGAAGTRRPIRASATTTRAASIACELTALIEDYFADMTSIEVVKKLDAAGIANGRLNEPSDVWEHVQFARATAGARSSTPGGPVRALLPPFTFTDVEAAMGDVPALGQHTDAVLRELGYAPSGDRRAARGRSGMSEFDPRRTSHGPGAALVR